MKWRPFISRKRPAMPKKWRHEIAERDGAVCGICGRPLDVDRATLDHIIPRGAGGPDKPENLRLAHFRCNVKRGRGNVTREMRIATREGRSR